MTLLPSGCWRMQSIFGRRRKPIGLSVQAKLCQDIIIKAIAQSSLNRNVTIKGGVVMRSLSKNARRATQDLDLDFIRYSISEESVR